MLSDASMVDDKVISDDNVVLSDDDVIKLLSNDDEDGAYEISVIKEEMREGVDEIIALAAELISEVVENCEDMYDIVEVIILND